MVSHAISGVPGIPAWAEKKFAEKAFTEKVFLVKSCDSRVTETA